MAGGVFSKDYLPVDRDEKVKKGKIGEVREGGEIDGSGPSGHNQRIVPPDSKDGGNHESIQLLSHASCVPDTAQGTGDTVVVKRFISPCLSKSYIGFRF